MIITPNIKRILSYGGIPSQVDRVIVTSYILPTEADALLTAGLARQVIVYHKGCDPLETKSIPQRLWYEARSVMQDIETSDGTLHVVFQKNHSNDILGQILRKILGMINNKRECAIVVICNSTIPDFIKDSKYIRCTYTPKDASYVLLRS